MKLNRVWMCLSIAIIFIVSIITKAEIIQIVASVAGVIYVFGCVYENRYGQLFGIVNTIIYAYLMYDTAVYGTAIYDIIYCLPMQIYTFYAWGKDKSGKNKLEVSRYKDSERIAAMFVIIALVTMYSYVVSKLGFAFAIVDGISIILGVFGIYLTANKKVEQWTMYIISNFGMLVLWGTKCMEDISNIPMLIMWIVYLINNFTGFVLWNKKLKENSKKDVAV